MIDLPKYCYFLVGIPASGKSTWVQENIINRRHPDNPVVLSSDNIIERMCNAEGITYNDGFQKFIDAATKEFNEGFKQAIKDKQSIVIDRTNLTIASRKRFISQLPKDYKSVAIVFTCEDEVEYKRRLISRPGKIIPPNVIDVMIKSYQEPSFEEGFSSVTKIFN